MRFCGFLHTVTLIGPCPGIVRTLRLLRSVRFWTVLYPVMLKFVREAAALLLGRFATVLVLVFLEGQQIGLLLLQLPLELLGLALLLQLPPLILLSVGRIKLNQNKPGRPTWKRVIFTPPAEAGSRLDSCRPAL